MSKPVYFVIYSDHHVHLYKQSGSGLETACFLGRRDITPEDRLDLGRCIKTLNSEEAAIEFLSIGTNP